MAAALTAAPAEIVFLDAARAIGHRLVRETVWHGDRCTWLGDEVAEGGEVIFRSMDGDVYGGTVGIGWFLAHLWAATRDEDLAAAARGGLRHGLARAAAAAPQGFYTGRAGIALAAVAGGIALGDDELVSEGARLAETVFEEVSTASVTELDVIGGAAGTVLALLQLARTLDEEPFQTAAVAVGERLLGAADPTEMGWVWPAAAPSEPFLCGFGHGASGIALALLELEAACGDPRFGDGARGALLYERRWFSRDQGNWPDLRELDSAGLEAGAAPPYLVYWCHGAAGIGLVRLRAHELHRDRVAMAEAGAAIDTATATMLRVVGGSRGGAGVDLSLCHGLGSVAELHVAAAEVTGDAEHLAHARRLYRWALWGREPAAGAPASTAAGATPALPDELPCGVPGGGETPGLMLGLAGIGTMLLRLHDPAAIPSPLLPVSWAAETERLRG